MRISPGKEPEFSLSDVCNWSKASPRQLEYWLAQQIIVPLQPSTGSGSHRVFSVSNVIEAATARLLQENGMSVLQLRAIFDTHRRTLAKLQPSLHAPETFLKYVQTVEGVVALTGPGPNYATWRKDVNAFIGKNPATFLRNWKRKQAEQQYTALNEGILQILSSPPRPAHGETGRAK